MSSRATTLIALCMVALVAACAQQDDATVYVDPNPVSVEPTNTGIYK